MKHERYEGIKNSDHVKTLEKIYEQGGAIASRMWCITEKVHGANFAIAWDGFNEIEFWSRERRLPPEENFNNYHRIRDNLKKCMERAYFIIGSETRLPPHKKFDLIIYGEICGGTYPHKDVEEVPNVRRVQKGVYYSPDIQFYTYDVNINGEFINYYSAYSILSRAGFLTADILFEGSFEECMGHPNKFQTTIPKKLGLPEIEDNVCEGWVLKPIRPERFLDGCRVILKSKNEIYDERARAPKQPKEPKVLSEKAQNVYNILSTYVTENRLINVLSHMNTEILDKKTGFGTIMGEFRKDIYEGFKDDNGNLMNTLDKEDKKLVSTQIGKLCVPFVKKQWLQILE